METGVYIPVQSLLLPSTDRGEFNHSVQLCDLVSFFSSMPVGGALKGYVSYEHTGGTGDSIVVRRRHPIPIVKRIRKKDLATISLPPFIFFLFRARAERLRAVIQVIASYVILVLVLVETGNINRGAVQHAEIAISDHNMFSRDISTIYSSFGKS